MLVARVCGRSDGAFGILSLKPLIDVLEGSRALRFDLGKLGMVCVDMVRANHIKHVVVDKVWHAQIAVLVEGDFVLGSCLALRTVCNGPQLMLMSLFMLLLA